MTDSANGPLTAFETFLVSRKNPNRTFSEVRDVYTTDTFNLQGTGVVLANPDGLVERWLAGKSVVLARVGKTDG